MKEVGKIAAIQERRKRPVPLGFIPIWLQRRLAECNQDIDYLLQENDRQGKILTAWNSLITEQKDEIERITKERDRLSKVQNSVANFALDLPKTHSMQTPNRTLCGLCDSFTFTAMPASVDCSECLDVLREQSERQRKYEHASPNSVSR